MAFVKGTADKIFQDLKKDTGKVLSSMNYTEEVKKDILALDVYDSGLTNDRSFGELKENPESYTIHLETPPTVTNNGFFYPIMPFYGLGTSRKYGPRKWFDVTTQKIESRFKINFRK